MSFVSTFDDVIIAEADKHRTYLEQHFKAAVIFYSGLLVEPMPNILRDFLDGQRKQWKSEPVPDKLVFVLNTRGGTAEAVERIVTALRHHFKEIAFVVPDEAMSAGTILCLSGNQIWMEYSSCLGPIDPQVQTKSGDWVPAVGYLNQVQAMIARGPELTVAEMTMLRGVDLAWLDRCQKAHDLGVSLLKKWLVEHKFADWTHHRTDPAKKGKDVTLDEKISRAEEIALKLSSNTVFHSHSRPLDLAMLRKDLRLVIDDYTDQQELRDNVRSFHDLLIEYQRTRELPFVMHGRGRA
jgi:hypothetical protein